MNCEYCKKTFKNKTHLKTHQQTAKYCILSRQTDNNTLPNFKCDCDMRFDTKYMLTQHKPKCQKLIVEENIKLKTENNLLKEIIKHKSGLTSPLILIPKNIEEIIDMKYKTAEFLKGQRGVAEFIANHIINTNGKNYIFMYANPDPTQFKFYFNYLDEDGKICEDINCKKLLDNIICIFRDKIGYLTDKHEYSNTHDEIDLLGQNCNFLIRELAELTK